MAVTLASVDGTWTNSPTYDAAELRRADAAMFASAGVASGLAVSVDGSDVVTVTRGQAVISGDDAVAGTGVYRAGIGSSVTGSLEARDATNSRIDLVVFRQYDTDVVGSHGKFASEIEIIKGTPSATPAVPSKPSMAVELARITVPASGGGAASVNSANRVAAKAAGSAPTDWADVPLGSGFSHGSSRTQVRKSGNVVTLAVSAAKPTVGGGDTVCTLPSGFRPSRTLPFTGIVGTTVLNLSLASSGVLTCITASSGGVNATISFVID